MKKTPTAPVQWPNHQVIQVDGNLKQKALVPGNSSEAIAAATEQADAAVKMLSAQFPMWMQSENKKLVEARDELAKHGFNEERLDRLFTTAHDMKGQAYTLGYPTAGLIGKLLCKLIETAPQPADIPLAVIDQHVNAISAIVRDEIKGEGNEQVRNVIAGLNMLNRNVIEKMQKQQIQATAS